MANKSGYKWTLEIGGSAVTNVRSISVRHNNADIDVSDLSHIVSHRVGGTTTADVSWTAGYKLVSGYDFSITAGTYAGADSNGITITARTEEIDTTDAADSLTQRVPGIATVDVECGPRYLATVHFLSQLETAAAANTSVALTVTDNSASTVIAGGAIFRAGSIEAPRGGAVNQTGSFGMRTVSTVAVSAFALRKAKATWSGTTSHAVRVKNASGTTVISGTGFVFEAGMTMPGGGAVEQSGRIGMLTLSVP